MTFPVETCDRKMLKSCIYSDTMDLSERTLQVLAWVGFGMTPPIIGD